MQSESQTTPTGLTPEGMRVLQRVRWAYILFRVCIYGLIWGAAAGAKETWLQHPLWFAAMIALLVSFAYARLNSALTADPNTEKKTMVILRLSFLVGVSLAFFSAGRGWMPWAQEESLLMASGVPLIIMGAVLLRRAQKTLSPHYYDMVFVASEQVCVQEGIYGKLRHPGYLGEYLITLGAVLMLNTLVGLFLTVALLGIAIMMRIHREEALLLKELPSYGDYASRVKRFGFI